MSDRASNPGSRDGGDGPAHADAGPAPRHDADLALARLEDALLATPFDRALPDLDLLLERAGMPRELLVRDDRALKVLHEAIVARPFGDLDRVQRVRTEVELLTLEVEVLVDRLRDADDEETVGRVNGRMDEVRARLAEIRREL